MFRAGILSYWLTILGWLFAACTPNSVALGPNEIDNKNDTSLVIEVEAAREGVSVLQDGRWLEVPLAERSILSVGQSVAVDETGRAIVQIADTMMLELLQSGEAQLQAVDPNGIIIVAAAQDGGTLVADLSTRSGPATTVDVETGYGTVTATGGRFAIVRAPDSPREWVLGLEAAEADLRITTDMATQAVTGGQAYWLTPDGEIGPPIALSRGIEAWLNGARNDASQPQLREILLPPANVAANIGSIKGLPSPGESFELINDVQGIINLNLDSDGIFGSPNYSLVDCNGDGVQDLAVQNGTLLLDFRQVLARVQALNVTVYNRDQPGNGLLRGIDPGGNEIGRQQLQVGQGLVQTLGLRSDQPYHAVQLSVSDACFLELTLTPPGQAPEPPVVQPVVEPGQGDTVVNILETASERSPSNGQLQAPFVGAGRYAGFISLDGDRADWDLLAEQSEISWTPISAVTHNDNCAARFPDSGEAADLAGQVYLAYDDAYLYVAFEVNDEGLVTYAGEDDRYFLGDSSQLLLDLDLNGDFDAAQLSADDVQLDLLPRLDAPKVALWRLGTLSSQELTAASLGLSVADAGYFVEAAIPWRDLSIDPQPGDRLGVVASVNDNDTPETDAQECIISTSPQRDWRNPITWGTVLLMPVAGN